MGGGGGGSEAVGKGEGAPAVAQGIHGNDSWRCSEHFS